MAKLEVRDLDAPYGAEVRGVDLTVPPDDDVWALLRHTFDDRGLLLFRDLDVTFAAQQTIVDHLLDAEDSLVTMPEETGGGNFVSNRIPDATSGTGRLYFHTDAMWSDERFELVSLYAVDVAPDAAPTLFASMDVAWRSLPADLRRRVEGLNVVQGEGQQVHAERTGEDFASNEGEGGRSRVTPIVWRHPRTGRELLYVSEQQSRAIAELPGAEGEELLQELFAHLYTTANVLHHQWSERDLAAWDNLAVQHGRPNVQLDSPTRTLRRATVPPPWLWRLVYDARLAGSDR